jgi:hypothetical protein
MTPLNKIRTFFADRKARKSRNAHLAAIQSRIHKQRKAHGPTRHLHDEAYSFTHAALCNNPSSEHIWSDDEVRYLRALRAPALPFNRIKGKALRNG